MKIPDKPARLKASPSFRTFLMTALSYRVKPGMAAWVLHRLTGLLLVIYLPLHVMGLRSLSDPVRFEKYVTLYRNPLFKMAEVALLAVVAFHAFNGIRILLQDLYFRSDTQRPLFYAVVVLTVLVTAVVGYPILSPYIIALFIFQ
ncbi:MAG: succinate dehydrogenase, cytochrome b556 subunit [Prosthecochloris sp.]|uniref:Succinate dehydrogenase cytochrome b556 subunit n=1 Tax=Prosthecochloris aestuarii (strain DSM 271 / SK 413) TaxID=290512 RepID=B4S6F6_PROA2|nr:MULTISPECIES: succinate dehydrogenase, cytochrome b556 subunit [Prosthecochloris]ACF47258.1 succinate dehydrogenase, cytochrome b556 subunit [Prosthecochloris aestuarii DSM 271]MCW8797696.1 succinate dehydrogenase, cytochrome b556 subunit [Prosthecochloris sp.]NEX12850.1 succinate dehydrogenase, cytochrome b556 subunit [Prosthecochloris sp.]